jgi:general secretion pathway protein G
MIARKNRRKSAGFTLIELIVVVTIIGILASIAVVNVINAGRRAREAALKHDLSAMRKAIDDFYADKQKYPSSLQDLVEAKYLRAIPKNPISGKSEDWEPVMQDASDVDPGADPNPNADTTPGMIDVKSPPIPPNEFLDDHTPYDEF